MSAKNDKAKKGNPVFLGFAIVAIVAAMVIFAFLLTNKKESKVAGSGATDSKPTETTSQEPASGDEDFPDHHAGGSLIIQTLDGANYDLTDFDGKIVILDFWATWCGPCKAEIPHFVELFNEYKDQDVLILGVSTDRSKDPVLRFRQQNNVSFPVAMATTEAIQRFGPIQYIPTTYIIDHNNNIVHKKVGYGDKAFWEGWLKKLIAEREKEAA